MVRIIGCALILTMLIFGTFDATAEILLQEDFEGDLDLTTKWRTNTPQICLPEGWHSLFGPGEIWRGLRKSSVCSTL